MTELKQQSFFSFSKKKDIKAEIELLRKDLEDFKDTEPIDLKDAYYGRKEFDSGSAG